MTDIRALRITPPEGDWGAVSLREAESPDGPWVPVQAREVHGPGSITIAFRPRVANGFYKPLWVAHGGSRNGLAEGEILRLHGAKSSGHGPIARIGGDA